MPYDKYSEEYLRGDITDKDLENQQNEIVIDSLEEDNPQQSLYVPLGNQKPNNQPVDTVSINQDVAVMNTPIDVNQDSNALLQQQVPNGYYIDDDGSYKKKKGYDDFWINKQIDIGSSKVAGYMQQGQQYHSRLKEMAVRTGEDIWGIVTSPVAIFNDAYDEYWNSVKERTSAKYGDDAPDGVHLGNLDWWVERGVPGALQSIPLIAMGIAGAPVLAMTAVSLAFASANSAEVKSMIRGGLKDDIENYYTQIKSNDAQFNERSGIYAGLDNQQALALYNTRRTELSNIYDKNVKDALMYENAGMITTFLGSMAVNMATSGLAKGILPKIKAHTIFPKIVKGTDKKLFDANLAARAVKNKRISSFKHQIANKARSVMNGLPASITGAQMEGLEEIGEDYFISLGQNYARSKKNQKLAEEYAIEWGLVHEGMSAIAEAFSETKFDANFESYFLGALGGFVGGGLGRAASKVKARRKEKAATKTLIENVPEIDRIKTLKSINRPTSEEYEQQVYEIVKRVGAAYHLANVFERGSETLLNMLNDEEKKKFDSINPDVIDKLANKFIDNNVFYITDLHHNAVINQLESLYGVSADEKLKESIDFKYLDEILFNTKTPLLLTEGNREKEIEQGDDSPFVSPSGDTNENTVSTEVLEEADKNKSLGDYVVEDEENVPEQNVPEQEEKYLLSKEDFKNFINDFPEPFEARDYYSNDDQLAQAIGYHNSLYKEIDDIENEQDNVLNELLSLKDRMNNIIEEMGDDEGGKYIFKERMRLGKKLSNLEKQIQEIEDKINKNSVAILDITSELDEKKYYEENGVYSSIEEDKLFSESTGQQQDTSSQNDDNQSSTSQNIPTQPALPAGGPQSPAGGGEGVAQRIPANTNDNKPTTKSINQPAALPAAQPTSSQRRNSAKESRDRRTNKKDENGNSKTTKGNVRLKVPIPGVFDKDNDWSKYTILAGFRAPQKLYTKAYLKDGKYSVYSVVNGDEGLFFEIEESNAPDTLKLIAKNTSEGKLTKTSISRVNYPRKYDSKMRFIDMLPPSVLKKVFIDNRWLPFGWMAKDSDTKFGIYTVNDDGVNVSGFARDFTWEEMVRDKILVTYKEATEHSTLIQLGKYIYDVNTESFLNIPNEMMEYLKEANLDKYFVKEDNIGSDVYRLEKIHLNSFSDERERMIAAKEYAAVSVLFSVVPDNILTPTGADLIIEHSGELSDTYLKYLRPQNSSPAIEHSAEDFLADLMRSKAEMSDGSDGGNNVPQEVLDGNVRQQNQIDGEPISTLDGNTVDDNVLSGTVQGDDGSSVEVDDKTLTGDSSNIVDEKELDALVKSRRADKSISPTPQPATSSDIIVDDGVLTNDVSPAYLPFIPAGTQDVGVGEEILGGVVQQIADDDVIDEDDIDDKDADDVDKIDKTDDSTNSHASFTTSLNEGLNSLKDVFGIDKSNDDYNDFLYLEAKANQLDTCVYVNVYDQYLGVNKTKEFAKKVVDRFMDKANPHIASIFEYARMRNELSLIQDKTSQEAKDLLVKLNKAARAFNNSSTFKRVNVVNLGRLSKQMLVDIFINKKIPIDTVVDLFMSNNMLNNLQIKINNYTGEYDVTEDEYIYPDDGYDYTTDDNGDNSPFIDNDENKGKETVNPFTVVSSLSPRIRLLSPEAKALWENKELGDVFKMIKGLAFVNSHDKQVKKTKKNVEVFTNAETKTTVINLMQNGYTGHQNSIELNGKIIDVKNTLEKSLLFAGMGWYVNRAKNAHENNQNDYIADLMLACIAVVASPKDALKQERKTVDGKEDVNYGLKNMHDITFRSKLYFSDKHKMIRYNNDGSKKKRRILVIEDLMKYDDELKRDMEADDGCIYVIEPDDTNSGWGKTIGEFVVNDLDVVCIKGLENRIVDSNGNLRYKKNPRIDAIYKYAKKYGYDMVVPAGAIKTKNAFKADCMTIDEISRGVKPRDSVSLTASSDAFSIMMTGHDSKEYINLPRQLVQMFRLWKFMYGQNMSMENYTKLSNLVNEYGELDILEVKSKIKGLQYKSSSAEALGFSKDLKVNKSADGVWEYEVYLPKSAMAKGVSVNDKMISLRVPIEGEYCASRIVVKGFHDGENLALLPYELSKANGGDYDGDTITFITGYTGKVLNEILSDEAFKHLIGTKNDNTSYGAKNAIIDSDTKGELTLLQLSRKLVEEPGDGYAILKKARNIICRQLIDGVIDYSTAVQQLQNIANMAATIIDSTKQASMSKENLLELKRSVRAIIKGDIATTVNSGLFAAVSSSKLLPSYGRMTKIFQKEDGVYNLNHTIISQEKLAKEILSYCNEYFKDEPNKFIVPVTQDDASPYVTYEPVRKKGRAGFEFMHKGLKLASDPDVRAAYMAIDTMESVNIADSEIKHIAAVYDRYVSELGKVSPKTVLVYHAYMNYKLSPATMAAVINEVSNQTKDELLSFISNETLVDTILDDKNVDELINNNQVKKSDVAKNILTYFTGTGRNVPAFLYNKVNEFVFTKKDGTQKFNRAGFISYLVQVHTRDIGTIGSQADAAKLSVDVRKSINKILRKTSGKPITKLC